MGFTGKDYNTKNGVQPKIFKGMIERILGERFDKNEHVDIEQENKLTYLQTYDTINIV